MSDQPSAWAMEKAATLFTHYDGRKLLSGIDNWQDVVIARAAEIEADTTPQGGKA